MSTRESSKTQGKLAREHVSTQTHCHHVSTQGTMTREYVFNTQGTQFSRLFFKIGILKNFANFIGKHLNRAAGLCKLQTTFGGYFLSISFIGVLQFAFVICSRLTQGFVRDNWYGKKSLQIQINMLQEKISSSQFIYLQITTIHSLNYIKKVLGHR